MRLRRSNPAAPGLTRRRAGRGWVLLDAGGRRVADADVLGRVRSLAIPPAWRDVWICPDPDAMRSALEKEVLDLLRVDPDDWVGVS